MKMDDIEHSVARRVLGSVFKLSVEKTNFNFAS